MKKCKCKEEIKNIDNWEDFWETEEGQDTTFWTRRDEDRVVKIRASEMKRYRRQEWEKKSSYEEHAEDREWKSYEVLEEDIQDFEVPQVIIGCDVESLYPSLDKGECVKIMKEEVKRSKIVWQDLDYLEGARLIAMSRSAVWCRSSSLRRVLPVRRGKTGTRPGVRGKGPMGKMRGDQEQWVFPLVKLTEEEKRDIMAEVIAVVVEALFENHLYTFGGKTLRQKSGGPIGLRATCAIARMVMCSWDRAWTGMMSEKRISINSYMRYMDDGRSFMPPVKPGWRWRNGELVFTKKWERADLEEGVSGTEITRRIVEGSMNEVFQFLRFTTEVGEGEEGWLPTLDLKIRTEENNLVSFTYYEKPTVTNVMVQLRSAMEENSRIQILSNDMRRRISNTDPRQGKEEHVRIVDMFARKLLTSGYSKDQVRKIILGGISGWERKKERLRKEGKPLYKTAAQSATGRMKRKLIEKSTWFRKRRSNQEVPEKSNDMKGKKRRKKGGNKDQDDQEEQDNLRTRTVLFVENTPGGALAKKLREIMQRIQEILRYRIKVVERAGTPLKLLFPLGDLGAEEQCERRGCIPCEQPGDGVKYKCKKRSILYENICTICNPGAGEKGAKITPPKDVPSIYVGESARSLNERTEEHWRGFRESREDSHILKHHLLHHGGRGEPAFHMRLVKTFRSALTRQVSEAVRIKKWGVDVVLNSKSEFNRCILGRLTLGEEEKSIISSIKDGKNHANLGEDDSIKEKEMTEEDDQSIEDWKKTKTTQKRIQEVKTIDLERGLPRSTQKKRDMIGGEPGPRKRVRKLKFELLSDAWGEEERSKDDQELNKDDLGKIKEGRGVSSGSGTLGGESNQPTTLVDKEDDDTLQASSKEEEQNPDTPQGGLRKEEAPEAAYHSPSRGKIDPAQKSLNKTDRQTSLDKFITSVRSKNLTDTQTVSAPKTSKKPRQDTQGVVKKTKSGTKRQSEAPSSGNILKFIKVKSKDKEDDISDGGGGRVLVSVSEPESRHDITQNKTEECVIDGNPGNQSETKMKKTTFSTVEGGMSVSGGGDDIVSNVDRDICVFGGGKCVTHNVKLKRSVKQKKMSVINKMGQVTWGYRDVTCLICPGRANKQRVSAKTIDSDVKGN